VKRKRDTIMMDEGGAVVAGVEEGLSVGREGGVEELQDLVVVLLLW
jgi:hypothetical protein